MSDPVKKCSDGYCEIPGGTFQIGSMKGDPDEQPARTVTMSGFQLKQTEVSMGEYKTYLATQPNLIYTPPQTIYGGVDNSFTGLWKRAVQFFSKKSVIVTPPEGLLNFPENKKGDNYPVVGRSYEDQRAYCRAQGGDLPTAAQLHYASRFDEQDSIRGWSLKSRIIKYFSKEKAIISENGFQSTEPVTSGYQNRFGVYNLLGNVLEGSLDSYDKNFYARMELENPYNPMPNEEGQLEEGVAGMFLDKRNQEYSGGSHFDSDKQELVEGVRGILKKQDQKGSDSISSNKQQKLHAAARFYTSLQFRVNTNGFRCARPLSQESGTTSNSKGRSFIDKFIQAEKTAKQLNH